MTILLTGQLVKMTYEEAGVLFADRPGFPSWIQNESS